MYLRIFIFFLSIWCSPLKYINVHWVFLNLQNPHYNRENKIFYESCCYSSGNIIPTLYWLSLVFQFKHYKQTIVSVEINFWSESNPHWNNAVHTQHTQKMSTVWHELLLIKLFTNEINHNIIFVRSILVRMFHFTKNLNIKESVCK